MLAELTVLMLAELNDFACSDIIAKRNDLPDSEIIEYRPYNNALIFHMIFSKLAWITEGKVSAMLIQSMILRPIPNQN